jgi:hypothetical protein
MTLCNSAIKMGDRPDRPGLRLAVLTWAVRSVRLSAALLLLGTFRNGDHHTYFSAATGTPFNQLFETLLSNFEHRATNINSLSAHKSHSALLTS